MGSNEVNEKELVTEKRINKKKSVANEHIKKIITTSIMLIALLAFFFLGIKYSSTFTTKEKTLKLGLKDVGKLVTQTCYTTVLEDSKENRDFFKLFDIPFTESRQIFSYDFEVDAFVDFASIKYEVDEEKEEITFTLPHAEVNNTTLKPDSLEVYLDSESWFSRIKLDEHNEALKNMEDKAKNDCIGNDLLGAADTNAKKLLEGFIKGNEDYKNYNIVYTYR